MDFNGPAYLIIVELKMFSGGALYSTRKFGIIYNTAIVM